MPPQPTPLTVSPAQAQPAQVISKPSPEDAQQEQRTKRTAATGQLSLTDVLQKFDAAKKYVNGNLRDDWDKYFKVYDGRRVNRNYEGISDPVNREAHTIIETLVANIAGGSIKFHFIVTNEEQSKDTEILNEMLDYYMLCNNFALKNQEWVRDMLLYGTGVLGVEWRDGEPFIFNVPLRDFFVDPTATGLVDTLNPARYCGFEYLADKEELKREQIYDAVQKQWVDRYQNLDKIKNDKDAKNTAKNGKDKGMDKEFKDKLNKSTLGDKAIENQVYIIKLYDLQTGRIYEVANRQQVIYDEPTWCQREEQIKEVSFLVNGQEIPAPKKLDAIEPFLPFAIIRDYVDSSQFYGGGEMALIADDAEQSNDYEAMEMDNSAYQNTPMYWIDPQYSDLAPEIETIPGAVYPIPRNAIGAIERPQLTSDLAEKQQRLLSRMRRATAADEAIQGVSQQQSRTTATEVSTQLQQAQTRFSTKISNLENEGYAQLALLIFKMVQIFVTQQTAVRIVGKMGVEFKNFDPWEYSGKWQARAQLDSTIKQHQVEVGLKDQAVFEAMHNNPAFNQIELTRWWVQKKDPDMSDEAFNKLLAEPAPPKPSDMELKTQADIRKTELTVMGVIFSNSPSLVQGQIEEQLGLVGDPSHIGDAHNKFLEQANTGADHLDAATRADGTVVPGLEHMMQPPQPTPQPASAPA